MKALDFVARDAIKRPMSPLWFDVCFEIISIVRRCLRIRRSGVQISQGAPFLLNISSYLYVLFVETRKSRSGLGLFWGYFFSKNRIFLLDDIL